MRHKGVQKWNVIKECNYFDKLPVKKQQGLSHVAIISNGTFKLEKAVNYHMLHNLTICYLHDLIIVIPSLPTVK